MTTTDTTTPPPLSPIQQRFKDSLMPDQSKIQRLNMRSPRVGRFINQAYEEAHEALEAGQYEKALQKYYWIINKLPYDSTAYLQRSVVYEEIGMLDEAIQDTEVVLKMSNSSDDLAEANMVKGVCLMKKLKFNEAIEHFDVSLRLVENDTVYNLKKKAEAMANPDKIIVPRYDDDYQYYNFITKDMIDAVQIKMSGVHGRGLFATRDIGAEELVFETFSIATSNMDNIREDNDHCHNCHIAFKPISFENEEEIVKSREYKRLAHTITKMTRLPTGRIIPEDCPSCHEALYCSPECKSDANLKHSPICTNNDHLRSLINQYEKQISSLTEFERTGYMLLLKMLAAQHSNGDKNSPLRPFTLDDHTKRLVYAMPDNSQFLLSRKESKLYALIKDIFHDRRGLTPELFYRFKSMITLNQLSMYTSTIHVHCTKDALDELGFNFDFEDRVGKFFVGIPLHTSFINHSCEPNIFIAAPIINDKQLRVVTKRPIKKGEELFVTYLDGHNLSTDRRREMLLDSYGFECKCPQCLANKTIPLLQRIQ
ncbi:hypothetical protein SAMD00019534_041480 [Acytostelium subglobosum LB1]|uniref:hypothetical protein n=1 Tax=Acytostelium subglobosum LB1 TaxID=1410327 RepID=UPI00064486E0|nr:hypothetical protein SAMD00019534_041480 [Acytostelium subglobosum LB1]GAM20973.1 hypothetical protein SAMD00019534_041480 [Acytostelium subglobosum LB1]|eukprot:XP_012756107.1 hypothetical protein SAMD00019534_041480 [Acytostelium subglobosum LB1]